MCLPTSNLKTNLNEKKIETIYKLDEKGVTNDFIDQKTIDNILNHKILTSIENIQPQRERNNTKSIKYNKKDFFDNNKKNNLLLINKSLGGVQNNKNRCNAKNDLSIINNLMINLIF